MNSLHLLDLYMISFVCCFYVLFWFGLVFLLLFFFVCYWFFLCFFSLFVFWFFIFFYFVFFFCFLFCFVLVFFFWFFLFFFFFVLFCCFFFFFLGGWYLPCYTLDELFFILCFGKDEYKDNPPSSWMNAYLSPGLKTETSQASAGGDFGTVHDTFLVSEVHG